MRRNKILEKEISKEKYENIKKIKNKWDNKEIDITDIPIEDRELLVKIYDIEIKKVKNEIEELENKIDNYKRRMQDAIQSLKK